MTLKHIFPLFVLISSGCFTNEFLQGTSAFWLIGGPFDYDVEVATPSVVVSTAPAQNVILKSPTTPDCYQITVTPNGTLGTKWVKCP